MISLKTEQLIFFILIQKNVDMKDASNSAVSYLG